MTKRVGPLNSPFFLGNSYLGEQVRRNFNQLRLPLTVSDIISPVLPVDQKIPFAKIEATLADHNVNSSFVFITVPKNEVWYVQNLYCFIGSGDCKLEYIWVRAAGEPSDVSLVYADIVNGVIQERDVLLYEPNNLIKLEEGWSMGLYVDGKTVDSNVYVQMYGFKEGI